MTCNCLFFLTRSHKDTEIYEDTSDINLMHLFFSVAPWLRGSVAPCEVRLSNVLLM